MTGFLYNYEKRSPQSLTPDIQPAPGRKYPAALVFRAECVDDGCISQVELVAIREAGTTTEQVKAEFPNWKLDGILCAKGHRLLFPDPTKSYLNE